MTRPDLFAEWLARLLRPFDEPLPLAERLERIVLGGPRRYTRGEVEARSGVSRTRAEMLWRALGFADVADEDVVFTDADVSALRLIDGLVGSGLLDENVEAGAARAAGQSLSRLAEWEIGLLSRYLLDHVQGEPEAADAADVLRFAETVLPMLEQLHSYIWRRHVAALAGRALAASPDELVSSALTVGFVDVVGYTRLTRQLDDAELNRLIDRFESTATGLVAAAGGRVVKTLGDEVMFAVDDALAAAGIALDLLDAIDADPELPKVRIGLARGNVLSRFGDVYGPVVNVASRLTTAAKPDTALVDRELAMVLEGQPGVRLRRRRPKSVRGYSNLSSWRLFRAGLPAPEPVIEVQPDAAPAGS